MWNYIECIPLHNPVCLHWFFWLRLATLWVHWLAWLAREVYRSEVARVFVTKWDISFTWWRARTGAERLSSTSAVFSADLFVLWFVVYSLITEFFFWCVCGGGEVENGKHGGMVGKLSPWSTRIKRDEHVRPGMCFSQDSLSSGWWVGQLQSFTWKLCIIVIYVQYSPLKLNSFIINFCCCVFLFTKQQTFMIKKPLSYQKFSFFNKPQLVGGLEHCFYFSIYWERHHPNWRTHIFQRGRSTTNQWMINHG